MRYQPDEPRYDDPPAVMAHAGKYDGGKALIVLGGNSAAGWAELYASLNPDVIIIANGANAMVENATYWLLAENMTRANGLARQGIKESMQLMEMFHRQAGAKNKFVSWHSWSLLKDTKNCVKIRRQGLELEELDSFSLREYGQGLLAGWLLKAQGVGAKVHVGTVGVQCLHVAGILGCAEAHTIGYDLCFKDHQNHHAYEYPAYEVDKFRTPSMFVNALGLQTQQVWLESAAFLKAILPRFKREGLLWRDHSDGLLTALKLECAT
jgi:hypothetical protein